jgi:hypothetical protein
MRLVEQGSRPPHAPLQDDDALAFYNEKAKDDNEDLVSCVFHDWQTTMEEAGSSSCRR